MTNQVTFHWSASPGKFVNKLTGAQIAVRVNGDDTFPRWHGDTAEEWYETLVETINDCANEIRAWRVVTPQIRCNRTIGSILQKTVLYRRVDDDTGWLFGGFKVNIDNNINAMTVQLIVDDVVVGTVDVVDVPSN